MPGTVLTTVCRVCAFTSELSTLWGRWYSASLRGETMEWGKGLAQREMQTQVFPKTLRSLPSLQPLPWGSPASPGQQGHSTVVVLRLPHELPATLVLQKGSLVWAAHLQQKDFHHFDHPAAKTRGLRPHVTLPQQARPPSTQVSPTISSICQTNFSPQPQHMVSSVMRSYLVLTTHLSG